MSYLQLITSYLEKNGASPELITVVEDYLEHAAASDEPSWSVEYDEVVHRAIAYANSKQERLRKHKRTNAKTKLPVLNSRHRQSLAQEAHSIRLALRRPSSKRELRSMIARLEQLEKLIRNSK